MEKLSEREKNILILLSNGFGNKEIGKQLNISIHTVKIHVTNLLHKLNVKNRTQAAFIAGKNNIVE